MKETEVKVEQNIENQPKVDPNYIPEDLYHYTGEPSPAHLNALEKDLNLAINRKSEQVKGLESKLSPTGRNPIFSKAGIKEDRTGTQISVFRMYLMAKENMDFVSATRVLPGHPDFGRLTDDFLKFIESHPVSEEAEPDPQKRAQNSVEMADLFMGAAEKMKTFQLPEIDYANPQQVLENKQLLFDFKGMCIDWSQEFTGGSSLTDKGDAVAIKNKYDEKTIQQNADLFATGQQLMMSFEQAYTINHFNTSMQSGQLNNVINSLAYGRLTFGKKLNAIKGIPFGEIMANGMSLEEIYSFGAQEITKTMLLGPPRQDCMDYLQGKNDVFVKSSEEISKSSVETIRQDINSDQYGYVDNICSRIDLENKDNAVADQFTSFYNLKTTEEIIADFSSEAPSSHTKVILNTTEKVFHEMLDNGNQAALYRNLKINPLDAFKIDGKRPEELWGEKYANVQDAKLRQTLLRAELVNCVLTGKKTITVDIYVADEKYKIHQTEPAFITVNQKDAQRQMAVFDEIEDLHKRLEEMRDRLAATQKDPRNNFETKPDPETGKKPEPEGSEYYRDMTAALKKCIELTRTDKRNDYTIQEIQAGLMEYQKKAAVYVQKRDSFGHAWRDNGKTRLNEAKDAAKTMKDEVELISNLAKGQNLLQQKYCGKNIKCGISGRKQQTKERIVRSGITEKELRKQVGKLRQAEAELIRRKNVLRQKLNKMSNDAVTGIEIMDFDIGGNSMTSNARKYLKAVELDAIKKAETAKQLMEIEKKINSDTYKNEFHQNAEALARDKTFIKCVQERPKDFVQTYYANQKTKEAKKRTELQTKFDSYVNKAKPYLDSPEKHKKQSIYTSAALVYTNTLVKNGELPVEQASMYAKQLEGNRTFQQALHQDYNHLKSGDQIKEMITGKDARMKVEKAMEHAREMSEQLENNIRSQKGGDFAKSTSQLRNEMNEKAKKRFGM